MKNSDRRKFVKATTIAGLGLGLVGGVSNIYGKTTVGNKGKRIGMIGLDTGHCMSFTKKLNDPLVGDKY